MCVYVVTGGVAALSSTAGVAVVGSMFGAAGAGLTGKSLSVLTLMLLLCFDLFS